MLLIVYVLVCALNVQYSVSSFLTCSLSSGRIEFHGWKGSFGVEGIGSLATQT
jgi:hypothetical protein